MCTYTYIRAPRNKSWRGSWGEDLTVQPSLRGAPHAPSTAPTSHSAAVAPQTGDLTDTTHLRGHDAPAPATSSATPGCLDLTQGVAAAHFPTQEASEAASAPSHGTGFLHAAQITWLRGLDKRNTPLWPPFQAVALFLPPVPGHINVQDMLVHTKHRIIE